jgi:putative transposase
MPSLQGKLSVERMCTLAEVSRAGFYRWLHKRQPLAEETVIRAAIQEIAVEHRRRYGHRRITAELRHRGMLVNRKRVLRMMQEDNLLAVRRRKFVCTTDSRRPFEVFLNLAKRMELTAPNQLWVADLTYIGSVANTPEGSRVDAEQLIEEVHFTSDTWVEQDALQFADDPHGFDALQGRVSSLG